MRFSELITFRECIESDHPFIFASWLNNYWISHGKKGSLPKNLFMKSKHAEIECALSQDRVIVAVLKDDPDTILGYAVFRGTVPVWAYIKKAWRSAGIKEALFNFKEKT